MLVQIQIIKFSWLILISKVYFKADVILNSTTGQLELNSGYVSQLILKSAGQEIQAECKQNYPNGIDAKTIAVTSSGMMKNIKRIFHMAYLNKFTTNKDCVKVTFKDLLSIDTLG